MKSLFSFGKRFISRHPSLLKISAAGYNLLGFNLIWGILGNEISIGSSFLKMCKITIRGKNNRIILGDKCHLDHTSISIEGNHSTVILGDSVCIHSGDIHLEDDGSYVSIGEKTLICGPSHLACIEGTKIQIGRDCLFSSETVIRTGDSHSIMDFEGKRINHSNNVDIGDRVWLGHRAICTKGALIGSDSVIATGAILTKSIENSNVVVAGNPARVVKENIKWCRERI